METKERSEASGILKDLDRIESSKGSITGGWAYVISGLAIVMALLLVWYNSYGLVLGVQLRAIHLAFILPLVFLVYPWKRKTAKAKPSLLDLLLAIMSVGCVVYMYRKFELFSTQGIAPNTLDLVVGAAAILLIFEGTRRTSGWPLVILSAFFLVYARYGNLFPGGFKIVPFSTNRIIYQMYYTDAGIFGTVLGVSATYIFLFILFGAFLGENKSSDFFTDLALAAAGDKAGGPGKVAVLSSALMGSISGSAVANVATTGTITIPLMKRVGYQPHFAGAVEAVASSGGQILPPVMASAAFIMAEMINVSYMTVITAALVPAILYYLAVWIMLDLQARKDGLKGLPKEELPKLATVLKQRGHLMIPLVILMALLIMGRTPLFAGFWGIVSTIAISALKKDTRLSLNKILIACRAGTMSSLSVAMSCAIVGIVVGVCSMTGVGVMVAGNIIKIANNNLFLAMALTMFACLILGMGLPTAACYITAAVVAAPALVQMGVAPIAAHLFVLYYAVLSNLTPPVALASFTAAGIADCSVNQTAITGFKLGITGFIVPFIFVFSNVLLLQGDYAILEVLLAVVTALIGVTFLSIGLQRYCYRLGEVNLAEAAVYIVAAVLMMVPGNMTDLAGILLAALVSFAKFTRNKRRMSNG